LEVEQFVEGPAETNSVQPEQESKTGCLISNRYPEAVLQWCELIQTHAQENGLDPSLVAAIILQESNGNPQAYSPSGAVGLMQIMPRDGIAAGFWCSSGPCFAGRPSMNELFDPEFNIAYGTRMFAGLVHKHGNVRDALRAYGPVGWGYGYADKVLAVYNQYR
jgi:soluble lytic murein transglycosylase-like protein